MDGFIASLICTVIVGVLVAVVVRAANRALDRLFSHDDAYLSCLDSANRELANRKRIN